MSDKTNIAEVIKLSEERFNLMAPAHMKYSAEVGFATQLLKNNPYLMAAANSNPRSLEHAIKNIAAIGLSLNPAEKLAYLISRNVKVSDNRWESRVFLEPSYMGLIRLATDSGSIKWCKAECVHANDDYVNNGPGNAPTHKYNAFKDRGDFVGVYCTAKTIDGDYLTTEMDKEQVESIRDRSEAWKRSKSGPWKTDFAEMAKKTVIRNAFKTWPRTDERRMAIMAQAVSISNENEGFEQLESAPEVRNATADQKSYFDQLIHDGDSLGMFVFLRSLQESDNHSVVTNLYHSFPKGEKGKYQRIVDAMSEKGRDTFTCIVDSIKVALNDNDDAGVSEIVSELDNDLIEMVKNNLTIEEQKILREMYEVSNG